ncbi:MAG: prolyl oligopeptidase family serine peptidase, partial [Gammaproteobacteria bacterium]|nr:prolyl oligopeptidase family serine peptidase [Gammaproteobacteria bacterium]
PAQTVAGGQDEAVVQPLWSPGGTLHYLSDRSDNWQVYALGSDSAVTNVPGEVGLPPWVFGLSSYAFDSQGELVNTRVTSGIGYLDGFPQYSSFKSLMTSGDNLSFAGAAWDRDTAVVFNGEEVVAPLETGYSSDFFPPAEPIEFSTGDRETAYALYFAPEHPDFEAPPGEKPPLIVLAHGGPTSAAASRLVLSRHFWTSRGFAVVDVNYRGSSGFGRAYRKKLERNWGIADVEDCVNAARFLVERGDVDPDRLIIRGGSAGGYTVLSALAFHDTFTAGTSMYGIADLEALAADTHKFESRYLEKLIGPYPEEQEVYRARSPIHHLQGFSAPMLVLQGSEDAIVPPNQSRMIVDALNEKNIPVAYIEFEGEQHGFRKAESIRRALLSELMFYGRIFGFDPADEKIPLDLRNF